jgi:ABC-2 type transport system ATP-binding protein
MARGRVAAVGTLVQIRDLLEDHPLSIRIEMDHPRELARLLLTIPEVLAVDVTPKGDNPGLELKVRHPKKFFESFTQLVLAEQLDIRRIEPLDESAHAILGYLLGGSGRT